MTDLTNLEECYLKILKTSISLNALNILVSDMKDELYPAKNTQEPSQSLDSRYNSSYTSKDKK